MIIIEKKLLTQWIYIHMCVSVCDRKDFIIVLDIESLQLI